MTWAENGRQRSLGIGRYSSGVTDERGEGILYAMPGKATVRVMVDHGIQRCNIKLPRMLRPCPSIVNSEHFARSCDRRWPEPKITQEHQVALASIDDRLEESQTATTDDEGKFQVDSAAAALCGLAMSADEQYMGFAKLSDVHQELAVPLQSTSFVAGKLVDPDNRPLANVEIQAQVVIENRATLNPTWFVPFNPQNNHGCRWQHSPGTIALPGRLAHRGTQNRAWLQADRVLGSITAERSLRPAHRLATGHGEERSSAKPLTLAEQWQRQLLDCRLNDYRLLVLIANKHKAIDDFLDNKLLAYNKHPPSVPTCRCD